MAEPKPGLWKIVLGAGILLLLIAFILGWIGFGVPDWQAFRRFNDSATEYYGLWAYCQEQLPLFSTICRRWPSAADQLFNGTIPNFVSVSDGLITTGMILLSFGFIAAVIAALLPLLSYLASGLTFLAFLFLVIGLPIFGRQSNRLSRLRGDASYNKRYGFWLIVPTIVLSFLAFLLFAAAGFLYQKFGFGNIATHSFSKQPYGGQRLLGPANYLRGAPFAGFPPSYGVGGYPYPYQYQPVAGSQLPSLLSQYIAQRMPRYYGPMNVQRTIVSELPQPSIIPVVSQPVYVTPSYVKAPVVVTQPSSNIINLTGRTLVGPAVRYA